MTFALLANSMPDAFSTWNVLHIVFLTAFLAANVSFVYDVAFRFSQVLRGGKWNLFVHFGDAVKSFVSNVVLQKKLYKHPLRGIAHVAVFYGFLYYAVHTTTQFVAGAMAWGSADPYLFHLLPMEKPGDIGALYNVGLDFVSLAVLAGLAYFAGRRWVTKAKELDRPSGQSALVISLIGSLMISTLLANAALAVHQAQLKHAIGPVSAALSGLFGSMDAPTAAQIKSAGVWHALFWWVHIGAVLVFMFVVPQSKHAHLIFAPFNFWFAKGTPKGQMSFMNLEDENLTTWGAANVVDFKWKTLLDGLACIECGRCTLSCPANFTGKALNPKKIMTDVKHALVEKMPLLAAGADAAEGRVIDAYTTYDELWACTSCYACVDQCPVGNNQLDAIFDMRRALVLAESNFPSELQLAFTNMENNYNPWGVGAHQRAAWADGLGVKIMGDLANPAEEVDYLYWVGCAGSFDERNKKIARSFVNIMNQAGVKFGILGNEETCTGDSARRAGNEYLYQSLANGNVETMKKYGVKKIVTACPHCFNTIKNEYPQFGGEFEVKHHSQFIDELVESGKVKLDPSKSDLKAKPAAFHDSCYMGRYNDEYSAPRANIEASTGVKVREIARSKSDGMCCGAGGAQMWMEEHHGKRINLERTEQLLEAKTDTIGTSCPFCITMVSDGVKAKELTDKVQVLDIAEMVEKALVQSGT